MKRVTALVLSLLTALLLISTGFVPSTAQDVVAGDVTGDGQVTDDDAIRLLMHVFFPEHYPVADPDACDYDGDGELTSDDAVWLLMHVFFPDEYPLVIAMEELTVTYHKEASLFRPDMVEERDKYLRHDNGAAADCKDMFYAYIPIDGAGDYITEVNVNWFGDGNARIFTLFDETKTKITAKTALVMGGTGMHTTVLLSITDDDVTRGVKYIGFSQSVRVLDSVVFVNVSDPLKEYSASLVLDSPTVSMSVDVGHIGLIDPLYGKTAVFDGDSICSPKDAWAGRIGQGHAMTFTNYGVGGGTITAKVLARDGSWYRHSVCSTVDKMYAEHPDADYIILEGGTNDADIFGRVLNGAVVERFGSYDPEDFGGAYDETTYCGAIETLLYKAKTYWPDKKIGFIIAMKMGINSLGYDKEHHNRRAYFETLMRLCDKWEIPYLNLWDECEMNPSLPECYDRALSGQESIDAGKLYTDGQHPTSKGYDYLVPIVEAWMKTL